MGIILGILLVVLGVLAAENFIVAKAPGSSNYLVKLHPFQEAIGITGLVMGFLFFLEWLSWLPHINLFPIHALIALASVLVACSLGIIFGLDALRRNLKDPVPPLLIHLEELRLKLLPYKETLGLAAIVLGIVDII